MTASLLAAADPEGVRRLLSDHGGRVRWTLRRDFDKVLDDLEIDDALSQASHRIWRSGHRVDLERGSLRAWFYVIARNCALRLLESKRGPRALRYVDDLDTLSASQASGSAAEPNEAGAGPRDDFARALHACIAKLPSQQQAVIRADLAAGGVADTAWLVQQLGTTANALYVARANARKTLRKELAKLGYPPKETKGEETGS